MPNASRTPERRTRGKARRGFDTNFATLHCLQHVLKSHQEKMPLARLIEMRQKPLKIPYSRDSSNNVKKGFLVSGQKN